MRLKRLPLSEIAMVTAGNPAPQEPSTFSDDGIPFIRMQDVGKHHHCESLLDSSDKIKSDVAASYNLKLFPKGSLLIPKSGASVNLNHRALLGRDSYVVSHLAVVTPDQSFINPLYLYYWSLQYDPRNQAQVTSLPSLPLSMIKEAQVPVPSMDEQHRIVDILKRADSIRRLRKQAIDTARQLIPALFIDMFGDPVTNPREWQIKPLGSLVSILSGGTPSKKKPEYWGGTIPWVSPKDMKKDFISDSIDHITSKALDETTLKWVPQNSVLIVVRGMILIHTVPIRVNLSRVTINQDMKALMPTEELTANYLRWTLQSMHSHVLSQISTSAHGTRKLDTNRLLALSIPLPPLSMQKEFDNQLNSLHSILSQQETATNIAESSFQSLLQRAFNG